MNEPLQHLLDNLAVYVFYAVVFGVALTILVMLGSWALHELGVFKDAALRPDDELPEGHRVMNVEIANDEDED